MLVNACKIHKRNSIKKVFHWNVSVKYRKMRENEATRQSTGKFSSAAITTKMINTNQAPVG